MYHLHIFESTAQSINFASPPNSSTVSDVVIFTTEVYDALINLDPTKAKGIDCISPIVLYHCAIALLLSILPLYQSVQHSK